MPYNQPLIPPPGWTPSGVGTGGPPMPQGTTNTNKYGAAFGWNPAQPQWNPTDVGQTPGGMPQGWRPSGLGTGGPPIGRPGMFTGGAPLRGPQGTTNTNQYGKAYGWNPLAAYQNAINGRMG